MKSMGLVCGRLCRAFEDRCFRMDRLGIAAPVSFKVILPVFRRAMTSEGGHRL